VDIAQQIRILVKVQALDAQIYNLRKEKEAKPMELDKLKEGLEERRDELNKSQEELKRLQLDRKAKEVELATKEEEVKKHQSQLYRVKTNKEYAALQKEIEGLKADNSVMEEEIINLLDEIDRVNEEISKEKDVFSIEEAKFKEAEVRVEQELKKIEGLLGGLNSERATLTTRVDPSILAKYERILANKDGLAMVKVQNDACQGCHINVPAQVINEIKLANGLVICENCSRILYIEE